MTVWDKRIEKAEKYLQKSRDHGRKVYLRYKDDREEELRSFKKVNLFYSNVQTIKESLFNSLPKPDVSRLQKDDYEDDTARVAAMILQRGLTYEVMCAPSFEAAVKYAIIDRLVPGTGQVWLRFEQPEQIFVDTLYWEDFIYEPARCWDLVGWVARKHELSKREFIERYGEEGFQQANTGKNLNSNTVTPKEISEDKYSVYEVWDKRSKKVFHICKGAENPLKELDDPYGLTKFFPCPPPMIANMNTTAVLAITDYHMAQDQYVELDILYARMSLIASAIKVAGGYDSSTPELARMLDGAENRLIPVDNWAMYAEKGGTKGLIDWYPVEQIVTVFQSLAQQYEVVKATLYEVTGMSDIMRGASNQYETAKAQEIKAGFASVRMNGYQRDVSQFVKHILNIMAQLMTKLYSDEKLAAIVGNFSMADQQYLPQAVQVLRDSLMTKYKVDITADSLTQSDWALEKGQRMELTGYISQFLTSAVPAIQEMPELAETAIALLKFTIVGYKGSAELEGILDQQIAAIQEKANQPPEPPPPDPEQQKMEAEMQKMQAEAQMDQQKAQMDAQIKMQEAQMKAQSEQQKAALDMHIAQQKMAMEGQMMQIKLAHEQRMNEMDIQMKQIELGFKQQEQQMKLAGQAASAQIKAQQEEDNAEIKRERPDSDD